MPPWPPNAANHLLPRVVAHHYLYTHVKHVKLTHTPLPLHPSRQKGLLGGGKGFVLLLCRTFGTELVAVCLLFSRVCVSVVNETLQIRGILLLFLGGVMGLVEEGLFG